MQIAHRARKGQARRFHEHRILPVALLGSLAVLGTSPRTEAKPVSSGLAAAAPAANKAGARTDGVGDEPPTIRIVFEKYQLSNGLEVILHEDHTLPLVAVSVWYHVGPVNEPPKRSGFAHLFEHLMFSGSKHVGKQFDELLESVGATNVNGTTSWDRTNYFETLPREFLELALWIESDRMGFLLDSIDQAALDTQRDVVKNERRQSFENAPYGPSNLALMDTVFPAGHPYHGAVIGSMADLTAATIEDVHSFYQRYYAPSNATLALAGDFDVAQTKAWIEKYFGSLRKLPKPPSDAARPPMVAKPARLLIEEPVKVPRIAFGWTSPAAYTPGSESMQLAAEILAGGKASRLYRSLVVEKALASDVSADADANALGTFFSVEAFASDGVPLQKLESALASEVAGMASTPPTELELQRAKRRILLGAIRDLQALNGHGGETGRLGQLQRFNHYIGDPGAITKWYQRLWAASAADVRSACSKWLVDEHRVTVVTQSKEQESKP